MLFLLSPKCCLTLTNLHTPLSGVPFVAFGSEGLPEATEVEPPESGLQSRLLLSGQNVFVLTSVRHLSRSLIAFIFLIRFGRYRCEKGTTAVLTEKVTPLELEVLEEIVQTMDTS